MDITKETIFSILRLVLGMATGWMVAKGWFSLEDATALISALVTVIGSIAWIFLKNKAQATVVATALSLPAGTTPTALKEVVKDNPAK